MARIIKLRQGLDIRLNGVAVTLPNSHDTVRKQLPHSKEYAIQPVHFVGFRPKVIVREGDQVKVGDVLMVDKACPDVKCVAPASGTISLVERGDRRRLLSIRIKADQEFEYVDFGKRDLTKLSADDVVTLLVDTGLMAYINQLPYAVVASPTDRPKSIFVSALRDMPLECDFEEELKGQETDFQTGLTALSRVATTHLGVGLHQSSPTLLSAKDAEVTIYDGRCPAGNVGVQVNHLDPVNKGEVVWTVDPTVVIFIGRVINRGRLDFTRTITVAGSEVYSPCYLDVIVGTPLKDILANQVKSVDDKRIINGNPLTGLRATMDDYLGAHTSAVTVISEGQHADELLGWIRPRLKDFSTSRSYFTWLAGSDTTYRLDARLKGSERHMIMSGEYDRMMPMDIYAEYLIKAIIAGNIDRQEALGIYEVAPEDFALAEFVCSSKMELQKIVRQGLDTLRKENA